MSRVMTSSRSFAGKVDVDDAGDWLVGFALIEVSGRVVWRLVG